LTFLFLPSETAGADAGRRELSPGESGDQPFYLPLIQNSHTFLRLSGLINVSVGDLQGLIFPTYLPAVENSSIGPGTQAMVDQIEGWEMVAPGVDFKPYSTTDPNRIYVARMWRNDPAVFLESSVGTGALAAGRETVSGMARRYDQAINAWGGEWGGRNKVVVAINGDYFDPITGNPENGQIQSGWYVKRYNDYEGWSGFVWGSDRSATIGQCLVSTKGGQYVTFADREKTLAIDGLNTTRGTNNLILYTPQFAVNTLTDDSGVEIVVEMERPLSVSEAGEPSYGIVRAIHTDQGSTPIPFDSVVLSGTGQARERLLDNVHEGDEIGITEEISSYDSDCQTSFGVDWSTAYAGTGGAFTFLRDGEPQHLGTTGAVIRNPRTAIALNDEYVYFIVVDGRQPGFSVGMNFDELAQFARQELDATWGIAQDGGGSSTMVINGKIVNVPSDRCSTSNISNVGSAGSPDNDLSNSYGWGPGSSGLVTCERAVSNGMMMVSYEPMELSSVYAPGDLVVTRTPTTLRLGPGDNYGEAANLPAGAAGMVIHSRSGLDGVQAKGKFWWQVTIQDQTGWAAEEDLAAQP
jgi:hypothetical protein